MSGDKRPAVYVAGTCDTKAAELGYVRRLVAAEGVPALLVDLSTRAGGEGADVTAAEVASHHPDGAQAVLFSYLHSQQYGMPPARIHLEGLDPNAMYRVHPLDPKKYIGDATVSGAVLMGEGVQLTA